MYAMQAHLLGRTYSLNSEVEFMTPDVAEQYKQLLTGPSGIQGCPDFFKIPILQFQNSNLIQIDAEKGNPRDAKHFQKNPRILSGQSCQDKIQGPK